MADLSSLLKQIPVDDIAKQLGIDESVAEAAVQQIVPGLVAGLAAFNLMLDFDLSERGVKAGLPKHMEWFCALGLMVSIVWLYLEILRLLSKLRR